MIGSVEKSGGDHNIYIDSEQSMEVMSPKNFTFYLGVMPAGRQQEIQLAVSVSDKLVKRWGSDIDPVVPLPSGIWLLSSGVIGLAMIRKKFKGLS